MDNVKTIRVVTFLAGISLSLPAWMGLFLADSPSLLSPLPALTVVPLLFLGSIVGHFVKAVILIPAILFFLWNPGLLRPETKIPIRTYVLFGSLVVLSVIWFVGSWSYGVEFQKLKYTETIGFINILWVVAIGAVALTAMKKASNYTANMLFHWMLFAWLGWYAFPYLGEFP